MKKQTAFRLPETLIESLQSLAKANNISLNKLVEDILQDYIDEPNNKPIETIEFQSFDELEIFFLANMKRWKLKRKATKVIGKKILIFSK